MTIFEIDEQILALVDEEGEVVDVEALDALMMERERKIENVVLLIKNLTAEIDALKHEEDSLAKRRKTKENLIARLKAFLLTILGGQKFETTRCSVSWRKSVSTEIDEETCLNYLFTHKRDDLLIYSSPHISKKAVGDALKAGEIITGAQLVEKTNPIIK